ncbi:hypothetical protein ACQE3E_22100 [Methylomonas sp. MED-D]|uniref:hypothetical protein n=1 Tax=unclassified Methylomonas TaxID=2608980 RepID=UPI0028A54E4C|nr:hypothetical protein [Methylomonas sp. MV1]MDT4331863.1 hypothetical protein [Methylomonas sp. MV1]
MLITPYFSLSKTANQANTIYKQASPSVLVHLFAEASKAAGPVVYIPAGRYPLTAPLVIEGIDDLTVIAEPGSLLDYSAYSADTSRVGNETVIGNQAARSALYFKNCARLKVVGLSTTGDSTNFVVEENIGAGIYLHGCGNARISHCQNFYGGALFMQDAAPGDFGTVLENCYSFGARNATIPGPGTTFSGCVWELPTDTAYDRIGPLGSSAACYAWAGRSHCKWQACTFKNIRQAAIKISGSHDNVFNSIIDANHFLDCGAALVYGGDQAGDADHYGLLFTNNACHNCATNRAGWHQDAAVVVFGSAMSKILNNTFLYTRDHLGTLNGDSLASATRGILVSRYSAASPEVTGVEIANNAFLTKLHKNTANSNDESASSPGNVINQCIYVESARGVSIHHNHFQNQQIGIFSNSNIGLLEESNQADNTIIFSQGFSNITPIYRNNSLLPGQFTSEHSQLTSQSDSYPTLEDNYQLRETAGQGDKIPMTQTLV